MPIPRIYMLHFCADLCGMKGGGKKAEEIFSRAFTLTVVLRTVSEGGSFCRPLILYKNLHKISNKQPF